MLDRLERSFQQASRFSADAAHELKTPLTILRGRIEQARRRPEARELHDELSAMLDEVGRLAAITRKLLLLSQADAGRLDIRYSAVNLTDTLNAMVTDIAMVVERRQFRHSIALGLVTQGDAVLLLQLLNNLISNALRYTPESGEINLIAHRKGASVCIEFSNSSLPISQAQRQRFFERFFRADEAHNRRVDGNGLGLSLAREIAKAHGGALDLAPSSHDIVSLLLTLPSA
jgi:signal transduction histidine kinase